MNTLSGDNLLKLEYLKAQIEARDREIANPYVKDAQVMNIHNARKYIGDRLIRTAKPHRILDPAQGPLIAVKLNILTRKTLGGFETDLDSRVFGSEGQIMPGLYAAGEAAGFGGGGMHGYRSLEGTFLGGCLFSDGMPDGRRRRRRDRSSTCHCGSGVSIKLPVLAAAMAASAELAPVQACSRRRGAIGRASSNSMSQFFEMK